VSADPVKNITASVKNRLLSAARQSGKPFQSLLTHYGLERFLFRLSRSHLKEKFILKGGLLLVGMGLPMARTTRDIDFLGLVPADIDAVGALIREIGNVALDDGLIYEFDDLSIEAMAEEAEYPGIRLKFDAWLGKARIPMQIDVGFGDAVVPGHVDHERPFCLAGCPVSCPVALSFVRHVTAGEVARPANHVVPCFFHMSLLSFLASRLCWANLRGLVLGAMIKAVVGKKQRREAVPVSS